MDTGEMMDRIEQAVRLLSGDAFATLRISRTVQHGEEFGLRATVHTISVALIGIAGAVPRSEFAESITTYRGETGETPPSFAELVAELHGVVMAEVERQRDGAEALLGSGGVA